MGTQGEWGTVQFGIPDFLQDAREDVNNFAEMLIAGLEVLNLALDFVKTFVKAFLDPLAAIIEAIIAEIVAILNDLRQIGIYITGDWALLGMPPEDLRGGYQNYERRMIARMTDRNDPTRPEISSRTKVFGFFAYDSVDVSELERLLNFIANIIRLFGLSFFPDTSRLPVPFIKDTSYSANVFDFRSLIDTLTTWDGTPPQKARVTWVTQPASQKHPLNPFPVFGPSGYLVTVSTLEEGIALKYSRPRSNTDQKESQGQKVQPREYGSIVGKGSRFPVVLHGGAEMLRLVGSAFEYNRNMENGAPKNGSCQVFGVADPNSNAVIPLEDLGTADRLGELGDGRGASFLLQRTFLVESTETLAQWFAGEYSAVLDIADMPLRARWTRDAEGKLIVTREGPASVYYVRVWSVGGKIADREEVPQWDFRSEIAAPQAFTSGQPFFIDMRSGDAALGSPSAPRKLTFANAHTAEYLHALQTALLLLVLTRSDMPFLDEIAAAKTQEVADRYLAGGWAGQGFALKPTGLEVARHLLDRLYPDKDSLSRPQNPLVWRADLYRRIKQLALEMYEQTGPMPASEAHVVEATTELRNCTWSQVLKEYPRDLESAWREEVLFRLGEGQEPRLLDLFNPDNPMSRLTQFGFCPNIYATGIPEEDVDELFFVPGALTGREDEFVVWGGGQLQLTFATGSPELTRELLENAPESLRRIYEKFLDPQGRIQVSEEYIQMLEAMQAKGRSLSSGDTSPVFVLDQTALLALDKDSPSEDTAFATLLFTRAALRKAFQNQVGEMLFQQAALVLNIGSAALTRAPEDGEWVALRLFDAMPELEEFLASLENWVRSLAEAVRSVADAIIRYIEFLQAQIVELQQLIRRINAFIQSLLSFAFALPQFSGLTLVSDGTDGLLADFVSAQNKPNDSPLAYGAGIAVVVPFAPAFIRDLIQVFQEEDGVTVLSQAPEAIGVEKVQPQVGGVPGEEPDVL